MLFSLFCFVWNSSQFTGSAGVPVFLSFWPHKAIRNTAQPLGNLFLIQQLPQRKASPNAGLIFPSLVFFRSRPGNSSLYHVSSCVCVSVCLCFPAFLFDLRRVGWEWRVDLNLSRWYLLNTFCILFFFSFLCDPNMLLEIVNWSTLSS